MSSEQAEPAGPSYRRSKRELGPGDIVRINLGIPYELYVRLERSAAQDGRSKTQQILLYVRRAEAERGEQT
jgi:hypothetical protein